MLALTVAAQLPVAGRIKVRRRQPSSPWPPAGREDERMEERVLLAELSAVATRYLRPMAPWEIDQVLGLRPYDGAP